MRCLSLPRNVPLLASVLAANNVETVIQRGRHGVTPTPVISRAILVHNRGRKDGLADGTLSPHLGNNPPAEAGGFKDNPTNGGPADTDVTRWVPQDRANANCYAGTMPG